MEPEFEFEPQFAPPVEDMTPPPKKPNIGLVAGVIGGILGAVVVGLVLWLSGIFQNPGQKFLREEQKLLTKVADRLPGVVEKWNSFSRTSVDMDLELELDNGQYQGMDLNDYLEDSAVALQLDMKEDQLLLSGDIRVMGEEFLSGKLAYQEGLLTFALPELDGNSYCLDLDALMEEETGVSGFGKLKWPELPVEELGECAKTYLTVLLSQANGENTTMERKAVLFEKLSGDLSGTQYVYTPTQEDWEKMILKLADSLETDQNLRSLVTKVLGDDLDFIDAYLKSQGEEFTLLENLDQGLTETAQDLRDNAADYAQTLVDSEFSWTLTVGQEGAYQQKISFLDEDNVRGTVGWEEKEGGVALWLDTDPRVENGSIEWVLNYEKSGDSYKGKYVTEMNDNRVTTTFDVDTAKTSALGTYYGTYTSKMIGLYTITMEVGVSPDGGTDHVVHYNIPMFNANNLGGLDLTGFTVKLHTTDKPSAATPPAGAAVDLAAMEPEEVSGLFDSWGEALEERTTMLAVRVLGL